MVQHNVEYISDPVIDSLVMRLRDEDTQPERFRATAETLGALLTNHMAKYLPTHEAAVQTGMGVEVKAYVPNEPYLVELERAGHSLLDGAWSIFPDAPGGKIGVSRSHGRKETLTASVHYVGLPKDLEGRDVFVYDVMLATGVSAVEAITQIKKRNPGRIYMGAVIAVQEGIDKILEVHPDVAIVCCAIDPTLNDKGYIIPGLGDAGDRAFGT